MDIASDPQPKPRVAYKIGGRTSAQRGERLPASLPGDAEAHVDFGHGRSAVLVAYRDAGLGKGDGEDQMAEHVRIANPTPRDQQRRFCECGRSLANTTNAVGSPYRACETILDEIEAEEENRHQSGAT